MSRSDDVDAIVVNLIRGANLLSENSQRILHRLIRFAEHCAQIAGRGEERTGFQLDNPQIIIDAEMEVEAALCLNDFAGANFAGRAGDGAAHFHVVETGR